MSTKFLFTGNYRNQINKNISRFIEECKYGIFKDDNLNLDVELSSNNEPEPINLKMSILELEFNLLDLHEDEKSITKNTNFTIHINSSKPCYSNLELNASTNVISYIVTINDTDIVVKNIKGNETVYIGSGKVTAGGKSKINDVEIWEFPLLKPGTNSIKVNRADVNLTIKYCERW